MNNNLRLLAIILLLVFALQFGGCKKWVDVNYDPSQLSDKDATPDLILPGILTGEAQVLSDQGGVAEWMGYWCFPYHDAVDAAVTYDIRKSDAFPHGGAGASKDVALFEANALRNNQPFYVGIAKFLKAFDFSGMVDLFNNVPYREAFRSDIRTPAYDSGQFIYEDLVKQLDTAITLIKGAPKDKAIRIGVSDIMCHGDKDKWCRVINTLKLRLLIHQANRADRQDYIGREIAKIIREGSGFLGSGEDAAVNPGFTQQKPSYYFSSVSKYDLYPRNFASSASYGLVPSWTRTSANTTAMNLLKNNRDPRLTFFYNPAGTPLPPGATEPFTQPDPSQYRGGRFGLIVDQFQYPYQGSDYMSQIGGVSARGVAVSPASTGIVKGYDMDCFIITSIESLFMQAEAIQRGWLPGTPETAYLDAVKESFRWLNVGGNSLQPQLSDDVFNTWYQAETAGGNVNVSWSAAPDKYKLLMFQKYMALNGINSFESYCDYRRNGAYPDVPLSYSPNRIKDKMPVRSPYPFTEYASNAAHVNAQGPIDIFTSKIWWMP